MPTNEVTVGCTVPASGTAADSEAIRELAIAAEELGYDSIWVSDHVVIPEQIRSAYPYSPDGQFHLDARAPYFEPLTVLTYLAGCTKRVRLGTHVLILPYRNPVLTAKMVTTLDNLSGGRVDLGIGVGWMREEFEALGYDYYDRRGAVTDEQVRVMKALWTEDLPSFDGEFYRFPPTGAYPHPMQRPHPPIWVGGHTKAAIRRTARLGDGWLPIGARPPADLPPAEIASSLALLHAEAAAAGRDPATIDVCFSTSVTFTDTTPGAGERRPFHGTPDEIAADVQRYRDVGVDRFIFGFGPGKPADMIARMQRFAEHVRPATR
jgi:probable F420-dependent oxidoreductase